MQMVFPISQVLQRTLILIADMAVSLAAMLELFRLAFSGADSTLSSVFDTRLFVRGAELVDF